MLPLILATIVSSTACGDTRQSGATGVANLTPAVDDLWADTVGPYLADPLWIDRDAYDAGHYLMVPMHAAFYLGRRDWQAAFSAYAQRFVDEGYAELDKPPNREARLQHIYLLSQFAVLATAFDRQVLIPDGLTDLIYDEVHANWVGEPAWHWRGDPFPGGMRERLLWKLGTSEPAHGFWRAITDEELFLLAIAADLAHYERLTGSRNARSTSVAEIAEMTRSVFEQEVAWHHEGSWVFQPGVWSDHRDYAFAGRPLKGRSLEPAPVPGIAPDTSHTHRFPLWLISFEEAWAPDSREHRLFSDLRAGLATQFFQHVLVPPSDDFPAYRTTNYMDGRNGIYRWEYATQGPGNGYGPYELSGTMLLGWWAFLGTHDSCALYAGLARSFPLAHDVVAVYVGPNTSRERHPLVSDPASYTNGFRQLIVTLAAALCDQPRWRQDVGMD